MRPRAKNRTSIELIEHSAAGAGFIERSVFVEAARAFGERILSEGGSRLNGQIEGIREARTPARQR